MKKRCVRRFWRLLITGTLLATLTLSYAPVALAYGGNISPSVIAHASAVAREIQAEGMVLLKNDDAVLPLSSNKITVFGTGSVSPFFGGSGSGAVTTLNPVDFYEGLDLAGIDYNREVRDIYTRWYKPRALPVTGSSVINNGIQFVMLGTSVPEMPVSRLSEPVMQRAAAFSDTAVIIISRTGSESADFAVEDLCLSEREEALVRHVTAAFDSVIVLFNTANVMEMGWLEEYASIKAAVWVGIPGEVGFDCVGKLLKGDINPSGKLADTVAYRITDHPSNMNFGDFSYTGGGLNSSKFVEYREGIYIGYRYFETFAPDKVQYPFGYGLSYTSFSVTADRFTADAATVAVRVTVKNTGGVAGKEVVQLYYSPPYTPGGIEKSAIVLGAYAKTDLLKPGQSQTLTLRFATDDMASYDYRTEQARVLEKGVYTIRVGRSVREHTATFSYTVDSTKVLRTDPVTGAAVHNRFDAARGTLSVFTREDAAGTYPSAPAVFSPPAGIKDADKLPAPKTEGTAPALGVRHPDGVITLRDVAEDEGLWDAFLDQLTLDEMITLTANCGYKTAGVERLGIPQTTDNDGPAAIKGKNGILYRDSGIAYPAAAVLACTWNDALAERFGESVGIEAEDIGTHIWYAPGANLHRNPRGGRNFEYYSEDPLLSGRMCAAVVRGAQSKNLIVTVKHFAVNDQETNRTGLFTWIDEQALRELYLKPFEMAVKDGGALGMMSGFNRIGMTWCGANRALLVDVLREEWGFKGFVVSDFSFNFTGTGYMSPPSAIYGHNNALLTGLWFLQAPTAIASMKLAYARDPIGFGTALRDCVKDLCYVKMRTNAFEGVLVSPSQPDEELPEIPQTGSTVISPAFYGVFGVLVAFAAVMLIRIRPTKKKAASR